MKANSVPYDLYLRFLYTQGFLEFASVRNELKRLELPPIEYETYEAQGIYTNANISPAAVRQIEKKRYDRSFLRWMDEIDVGEMWYGTKPFKDSEKEKVINLAMDIHSDPVLRLTLNALLIKNVSVADLVPMLNIKFSTSYKSASFELYRYFFFDSRRMKRSDWRAYLSRCSDKEKSIYFCALTEPLETVKCKLGLPSRVEVSEELSRLLRLAIDKSHQYLSLGSKETNHEARAWISTVLNLTEKYEKYRTADSSDFGKALQMEFEYVDTNFDSPDAETLEKLNTNTREKEEKRVEDEGLFPGA